MHGRILRRSLIESFDALSIHLDNASGGAHFAAIALDAPISQLGIRMPAVVDRRPNIVGKLNPVKIEIHRSRGNDRLPLLKTKTCIPQVNVTFDGSPRYRHGRGRHRSFRRGAGDKTDRQRRKYGARNQRSPHYECAPVTRMRQNIPLPPKYRPHASIKRIYGYKPRCVNALCSREERARTGTTMPMGTEPYGRHPVLLEIVRAAYFKAYETSRSV
ncbi:hypothetical protein EC912_11070 [Luteibacter rhizovicinus]|uniref:Uncharacterized protein n=1 Tax=Luteibacter rhizovicinus TaxID=242606 RepID=A0A4R3YHJ1_9GAMM|nr:hypothetical protein EC912_11070 [Luteibacter rhizovicinus]